MKPHVRPTKPDKLHGAAMRERMRGLTPEQAADLRRAIQLLDEGERLLSGQLLLLLSQQAPDHPEVQRWCGLRHAKLGEWQEAVRCLAAAAAQRPDDVDALMRLAAVQEQLGDHAAALRSLQAALRVARSLPMWLALSVECDRQGYYDEALQAVEQALRLDTAAPVLLLQRARCNKALGNAQAAADDCRALIASGRESARAWFALVDLKTVPLSSAERSRLAQAAAAPALPADQRVLLDFALGKALEDAGEPDLALAALQRANQAARAAHRWDADGFRHHVAAVRAAFEDAALSPVPAQAIEPDAAPGQGREVLFLVGLPRSGTTLVEQVLASHSRVEGASELPYLNQVIDEESQRCGRPFPAWVAATTAADWARLGQRYLQLSARWRAHKPVSTDKLPDNWLLAGAALAMLPQARVIDCRRDPLETCWSCYKQLFGPGHSNYSYAFEDLAAYWHAYDGLCRFWAQTRPARFRVQQYEALVADKEGQIRALMAFCDLPFEPQCLQFQTAQRAIRTPSALQVRQPMVATSTPAARYGDLLDPLRSLLAGPAE